jgi:hypothetical protein
VCILNQSPCQYSQAENSLSNHVLIREINVQGQVHSGCKVRVTLFIMGLATLVSYVPQLIEHSLGMLILARGEVRWKVMRNSTKEGHAWGAPSSCRWDDEHGSVKPTLIEKQVELKLCH